MDVRAVQTIVQFRPASLVPSAHHTRERFFLHLPLIGPTVSPHLVNSHYRTQIGARVCCVCVRVGRCSAGESPHAWTRIVLDGDRRRGSVLELFATKAGNEKSRYSPRKLCKNTDERVSPDEARKLAPRPTVILALK
jgi:hypothetical protein